MTNYGFGTSRSVIFHLPLVICHLQNRDTVPGLPRLNSEQAGMFTCGSSAFVEARNHKVAVEADDVSATRAFHDREADGIGIGDRITGKLLEPGSRRLVMRGDREFDSDQRVR